MLANIKAAFGQALGRELLELETAWPPMKEGGGGGIKEEGEAGRPDGEEEGEGAFRFTARGFVSNANYHMKKGTFMLFINNRLVRACLHACMPIVFVWGSCWCWGHRVRVWV